MLPSSGYVMSSDWSRQSSISGRFAMVVFDFAFAGEYQHQSAFSALKVIGWHIGRSSGQRGAYLRCFDIIFFYKVSLWLTPILVRCRRRSSMLQMAKRPHRWRSASAWGIRFSLNDLNHKGDQKARQ